jgi:xanthine dehydrogenase accessory factor
VIADRFSEQVQQLIDRREPFVLATVVRARRPTSVRPGDHAVVRRDGTIEGFVGGVCAESSVRLHSLRAMETGEPLLLRLLPDDAPGLDGEGPAAIGGEGRAAISGGGAAAIGGEGRAARQRRPTPYTIDGAVVEHNPCLSGGALEIFLEPHLPPSQLVVIGGSPIALALERLALAAGYDCIRSPSGEPETLERAAAVVVSSHGNGEEAVLAQALRAGVPYVALVASPRRGAAVIAELDVADELRTRLHTPAGLNIGARTPAEIAISILAELVAEQHSHPVVGEPGFEVGSEAGSDAADRATVAATATDPICGMAVAVSPASQQLRLADGDTVYFCGPGCRERYAREHAEAVSG